MINARPKDSIFTPMLAHQKCNYTNKIRLVSVVLICLNQIFHLDKQSTRHHSPYEPSQTLPKLPTKHQDEIADYPPVRNLFFLKLFDSSTNSSVGTLSKSSPQITPIFLLINLFACTISFFTFSYLWSPSI